MPGVKGRSGGHNRKGTDLHKFMDTYREDRHGHRNQDPTPIAAAPEHFDGQHGETFAEVATMYQTTDPIRIELTAVHLHEHRRLDAVLRDLERRRKAGETVGDTSPIRRALRQEAQLILSCIAGLQVRQVPKVADDAEDKWAGLLS